MAKVFYAQRLPSETIAAIKILAVKLGVSESQVLVRAVAEFIPGDVRVKQAPPVLNKTPVRPATDKGDAQAARDLRIFGVSVQRERTPILKPSAKSL